MYLICAVICTVYLPLHFLCSVVSEMVIFLFVGLSLFDEAVHDWDTGLVLWTLLFAFLFRPIGKGRAAAYVHKLVVQCELTCVQYMYVCCKIIMYVAR